MRTLCALVLVLAACGDDPPNVSSVCTATDGCDDGLTCNTTIPDGYCTASCTTDQCPDESICDVVSGNMITCVRICKSSSDCRSDLDCNGVSGSNIKACKPKP